MPFRSRPPIVVLALWLVSCIANDVFIVGDGGNVRESGIDTAGDGGTPPDATDGTDAGALVRCLPPYIYYAVGRADGARIRRQALLEGNVQRCRDLTGGGQLGTNASNALMISADRMLVTSQSAIRLLEISTDSVVWTVPISLEFASSGRTAVFRAAGDSFGVGWELEDSSQIAGTALYALGDGRFAEELSSTLRWHDVSAADVPGELWAIDRFRVERFNAAIGATGDVVTTPGERVDDDGDRLLITTYSGYRAYRHTDAGLTFVDSHVFVGGECDAVDVVPDPRDGNGVVIGCAGESASIGRLNLHATDTDVFVEIVDAIEPGDIVFDIATYAAE